MPAAGRVRERELGLSPSQPRRLVMPDGPMRADPDLSAVLLDSTVGRAPAGAAGAPQNRRRIPRAVAAGATSAPRSTSLTDRQGRPLGLRVTGGSDPAHATPASRPGPVPGAQRRNTRHRQAQTVVLRSDPLRPMRRSLLGFSVPGSDFDLNGAKNQYYLISICASAAISSVNPYGGRGHPGAAPRPKRA